MRWVITCVFLMIQAHSLVGQEEPRLKIGNSISFTLPSKEWREDYSVGLGFSMNLEHDLENLAVVGEFGWVNWFRRQEGVSESELSDAWLLLAGLRYYLTKMVYVETRTGYYFKIPDSYVLLPAGGVRLRRLDLNIGYSFLENSAFLTFRVGYIWGD